MTQKQYRQKSAVVSERQTKYVDARASGLDKQDALAVAGYSATPSTASELDKMPSIKEALSAEFRKNQIMLGFTREDVLQGMKTAVEQAVLLADPTSQIAGWREIGKIIGCYAPEVRKIELTANGRVYLTQLEQMDDAELLKLAEADVLEGEFKEVQSG